MIPAFSGEDPLADGPNEDNWHHEGLTRKGTRAAGFSAEAENAVSFHADYLDSYLYNPLWWFSPSGGGPDRMKVVLSSQADLVKVHFDDLFSADEVRTMWRRYLSGTVSALVWVGHDRTNDVDRRVAMAQNVLGVSLHAIQDFYSHSNWIDDSCRRDRTWFEVPGSEREEMELWTGSYELPHYLGVKPHGAYTFACTVFNNFGSEGRRLMDVVCHAASPLASSPLCELFRECKESVGHTPPSVDLPLIDDDLQLPENLLWAHPGINVDSRWQAPIGVAVRQIDLTGPEAFEIAYRLASRSSCQWLHILGHVMADAGLEAFWTQVQSMGVTTDGYKTSTAPWEDFNAMPYRMVSAGSYPPGSLNDMAAWYLRLSIRTADEDFAGTDADIVAVVDGRRMPVLDHGIPPHPQQPAAAPSLTLPEVLLGHNDFERGDVAAYILGPFDTLPTALQLENDAPTAGEVAAAALDDLGDGIVRAFESLISTVRNLWGYDADFVDSDHSVFTATTLEGLADNQIRPFTLHCNGGSEGEYLLNGDLRPNGVTGRFSNGVAWREYRVRLTQLICLRESEWDRFTSSDEPFVLALVVPHGGGQPLQKWRSEPEVDVDAGEIRPLYADVLVRVPQRYGFISVAGAVYESDDETPNDRDRLLDTFAGQVSGALQATDRSFFETLGAAIASAWKLESIDVVAFRRGSEVEVNIYPRHIANQWVDGGASITVPLSEPESHSVTVPDQVDCGCESGCLGDLEMPKIDVPVTRIQLDGRGRQSTQKRELIDGRQDV